MIRLIQGRDRRNFPREIDEMFRLRAQVFRDRMGWDVVVKDGWEIDRFDELGPLYLLCLDDREVVRGSARLLPTTGPHMLNDVFSELLPGGNPVRSALMWESSRFSVDRSALAERTENRMNRVTGELLIGIFDVAARAGLEFIVSVYDVMMGRVLKRSGCHAEPLGPAVQIGKALSYAGLFEVGPEMMANLRAASGITEDVIEVETARTIGLAAA
jgi:N-acyl-L-homoserine lactone synthetase